MCHPPRLKCLNIFRSLTEHQLEAFTVEMYNRGRYSPSYVDSNAMPGIEVFLEDDDEQRLENLRRANTKGGFKPADVSPYLFHSSQKPFRLVKMPCTA